MELLYEDIYYDNDCCKQCEQKEQIRDDMSDYLEGIVEQLYSKEAFDKEILEHCLSNLCFLLQVKVPKSDLQVDRKRSEIFKFAVDLAKNHAAFSKCV